jgi:hypothetical protein
LSFVRVPKEEVYRFHVHVKAVKILPDVVVVLTPGSRPMQHLAVGGWIVTKCLAGPGKTVEYVPDKDLWQERVPASI